MKFLTEDDLRTEYRNLPFETFTVKKDQRLTPGARTFLLDRKVKILDEKALCQKTTSTSLPKPQSRTQERTWREDTRWLDIRCELLQVAFDLASSDLVLAQELTALERYLASFISGGECLLPPLIKGNHSSGQLDRKFIVGNLSNVGLFLQTENGRVLTKLYPLYFRLERVVQDLQIGTEKELATVLDCIGQLIAYYLQTREEVSQDATNSP